MTTASHSHKPYVFLRHSGYNRAVMTRGKQKFIAELFQQQASGLVQFLTARFQNRSEAEEVAQEAWLRIYRLENPDELDNAKAFLYQTASNLSIDRFRRRALETRHADTGDENEETQVSVDEQLAAEQAVDIIQDALYELPYKCRQAFVMHRYSGLSYSEIAGELDVSTSMVEKYIIQALKHFRNKLEQNGTEGL